MLGRIKPLKKFGKEGRGEEVPGLGKWKVNGSGAGNTE